MNLPMVPLSARIVRIDSEESISSFINDIGSFLAFRTIDANKYYNFLLDVWINSRLMHTQHKMKQYDNNLLNNDISLYEECTNYS